MWFTLLGGGQQLPDIKTRCTASDERWVRDGDGGTHQAEVMSVNMVDRGIHIPKQDMVAITWSKKWRKWRKLMVWGCRKCVNTPGSSINNQEINGAGLLLMWNAVPFLPALRRSPRWSRSSYWPAPSCRCRRTPPGRPAWTPQPWRWAPSTGWGQTCPALEMATKKMRRVIISE